MNDEYQVRGTDMVVTDIITKLNFMTVALSFSTFG